MCGINNLKRDSVISAEHVRNIYDSFKSTFELIRHFNPRASLFVCSVLPTKSHNLNKRVEYFNDMIFNDLVSSGLGVMRVFGFHRLLDQEGLLSQQMSKHLDKHGKLDQLHINDNGTRLVAGLIKIAIFLRLNKGIDKRKHTGRVDGRSYSNATIQGPPTPRWIGRND